MFHMDWIIINTESCRGFKTALLIVEVTTRKKWGFPTRSRSTPIEIVRFFIKQMHLQCYSANVIRVDEDGSLVGCAEFMKVCVQELGMTVESTG